MKPRAAHDSAAIGQAGEGFELCRHSVQLGMAGKPDPEPVTRAEHAAELFDTEFGISLGHSEAGRDFEVIGTGSESEQADSEASLGG